MQTDHAVYRKLQRHLNRQAVGFPATRNGAEIRILKRIFSPHQARLATCLTYRPEPLAAIYARARKWVASQAELAAELTRMQQKGGIETQRRNGEKRYCNAPLVVGMYEMQLERLTPEFVADFNAYTGSTQFALDFLSTELPQMRTIPVSKSIQAQHQVAPYDEVMQLLERAQPPFVVLECICRKKKAMEDKPCRITDRKETCLGMGQIGETVLETGIGRHIDRSDAKALMTQNQKDGLILQPSNTAQADFICSCCGCCCGMLSVHRHLPRPVDFWASNFQTTIDADNCNGCGVCEDRCQVAAVTVAAKGQAAVLNPNRCIGCGVCVTACPKKAITLVPKKHLLTPPTTREDLYEIIMAHKKGPLGKLRLTGKLVLDSLRAGSSKP